MNLLVFIKLSLDNSLRATLKILNSIQCNVANLFVHLNIFCELLHLFISQRVLTNIYVSNIGVFPHELCQEI